MLTPFGLSALPLAASFSEQ
jgi:hypothetical protein